MDKYKKKMFSQLCCLLGVAVVAIVVTITLILSDYNDHTLSFMYGLTSTFIVIVIITLVNIHKLIKNPQKLHQKAVEDADERNVLIEQKVQAMSYRVFVGAIAVITIAFAFYDVETMFLMSGILWLALMVKLMLNVYYKKKI